MTKLNTADGSPMTALRIMALQLRIADFKFTDNFIICDRLPDMEILFGIDIQKKISLSYASDKEKNYYIQKIADFSPILETVNRRQLLRLSSQLSKYHPDTMASFQSRSKAIQSKDIQHTISDQDSTKGKDPNINIINGIPNIKGKTSVNILISN